MEKVIEIYYPQSKERRIKTVRQNQDPNRWKVTEAEKALWEKQRIAGERAHAMRWAGRVIEETLREERRVF